MEKIIIYTCITGGYDTPTDNFPKKEGYEYRLYTDKDIYLNSWDVYVVHFDENDNLGDTKRQRFIKTHPQDIIQDYDTVVWIDANATIDYKLYNYIEKYKNNIITFKQHPDRDCIYDEIKEVCLRGKETRDICEYLFDRYNFENYPTHYGLFETNVIISHPHNESVKKIFTSWWDEIRENSKRDQLSLNYILWKDNLNDTVYSVKTSDFPPKIHIRQL